MKSEGEMVSLRLDPRSSSKNELNPVSPSSPSSSPFRSPSSISISFPFPFSCLFFFPFFISRGARDVVVSYMSRPVAMAPPPEAGPAAFPLPLAAADGGALFHDR